MICAAGTLASLGCAQDVGMTLGLKGGAINTGVHSGLDRFLSTDWRTGYVVGGFVTLDLTPFLVVEVDLLYAQRGFGFRMHDAAVPLIPGEVRVGALETHVLIGLSLPWQDRLWRPRVYAGPAFGFERSCEVEASTLGVPFKGDCRDPVVGLQTHDRDAGLIVGGAVDITVRPFSIVVDGRYGHGLRNLLVDPGSADELNSRAWSFTFGVGWRR
jgi:hypothetical protein